jgi:hypothetical protein
MTEILILIEFQTGRSVMIRIYCVLVLTFTEHGIDLCNYFFCLKDTSSITILLATKSKPEKAIGIEFGL